MNTPPPILRPARGFGSAFKFNMLLPGAGLFVLGHRMAGVLFAGGFLLCFVAVLGLSLVGYTKYLTVALGGDLLQEGRLEQIETGFHTGWVIALLIVGMLIYAASMVALFVLRARAKKQLTPGP